MIENKKIDKKESEINEIKSIECFAYQNDNWRIYANPQDPGKILIDYRMIPKSGWDSVMITYKEQLFELFDFLTQINHLLKEYKENNNAG